jgi:hypothetical protein
MRKLFLPLLFACVSVLDAQTPPPAPAQQPAAEPQLSPQAAYDQASRPLDIVRRSPQNWSEIELNALKAARNQAAEACSARDPEQFEADDLLALCHLCAFGQKWQPVFAAASKYLDPFRPKVPGAAPKTLANLSVAYDWKVQGSLNLDEPFLALQTAQIMLRSVPYDEFASEATNSTARYLHFLHSSEALALLAQRQPLILAELKARANPPPENSDSAPATHPPLPLYALYSDALALPAMQQFLNQTNPAAESYQDLEAALPTSLSSEDGMFIAEKRRQYLLLGSHLPVIAAMGSLLAPDAPTPKLNGPFTAATVLMLFPDWCNQCIAMAFNSPPRAKELLETYHARFFPLITQADPPEKHAQAPLKDVPLPPSKSAKGASTAPSGKLHVDQQINVTSTPDARLAGTPTVVVPNETLNTFTATDFPLLIVLDHDGIIRAILVAPEDALAPGGDVDQLVHHVVDTWPPP